MNLQPVILCGGSGTRLWPLSRESYPKQLLALLGQRSLLQDTLERLRGVPGGLLPPLVVCNEAHRFLVADQVRGLLDSPWLPSDVQLVLEPAGRNTAPAAAAAALLALERTGADVLLLILPADHLVREPQAFAAAVTRAIPAAQRGELVTFGVVPTHPETGYGYIRAAPAQAGSADEGPRPVERFVEKPDFDTARRYVQSGDYLWNSGMFCFSANSYLAELEAHAPGIVAAVRPAIGGATRQAGAVALGREAFLASPTDSIDYAVFERTARAAVVPLSAGWSDVGSWGSLLAVSERDPLGNVLIGDVLAIDCQDSYLRAESRLVGVVGLRGCIVVETRDAVLVVPADRSQEVRRLVDELERTGRPESRFGREVFRPWGSFDSLDEGTGFQVKRLTVLPGAVLSLQLHHRRSEHWVVVGGVARVTRGAEIFDLAVGQHAFIPRGEKHRVENPGTEILHIIEIQVGDYLGEDDIVRFEDRYGRQGRTD